MVKNFLSAFDYLLGCHFDENDNLPDDYNYDWAGWFPILGFIYAVFSGLIAEGYLVLFPQSIAAFLTVITIYCLTWFVNLRAVSKMIGEFTDNKRCEMPEEKRSPRVCKTHSAGVFAVLSAIFCKSLCLSEMPTELFAPAVATSVVVGRCWLLSLIILVPAKNPEGIISKLKNSVKMPALIFSGIFAVFSAGLFAGFAGISSVWFSMVIVALFGVFCMRRVGGISEASLISGGELSEIICLLTFASYPAQEIVSKTGIYFWG